MKSKMIAFFLSVAAATTSFMKIPVVSADNGINITSVSSILFLKIKVTLIGICLTGI